MPSNLPFYPVIKAKKADKKNIMRFYKAQHYAASYIGQDQCYFIKVDEIIIACAMVSAGQESGEFWLLHALVVNKKYQGRRIASQLLQTIFAEKFQHEQTQYRQILCFADNALSTFYYSNQFINYNAEYDIAQLPKEFKHRYVSYRKKQKSLQCFLYQADE
jgi:N-acetylglutamate synthase-like GNAT family acetyltransferase